MKIVVSSKIEKIIRTDNGKPRLYWDYKKVNIIRKTTAIIDLKFSIIKKIKTEKDSSENNNAYIIITFKDLVDVTDNYTYDDGEVDNNDADSIVISLELGKNARAFKSRLESTFARIIDTYDEYRKVKEDFEDAEVNYVKKYGKILSK
jgi:hypothetical protein